MRVVRHLWVSARMDHFDLALKPLYTLIKYSRI